MALVPSTQGHEPIRSSIDDHAKLDTPIDFCFMNITDFTELPRETPRKHKEKDDSDKFQSKSLRLPHNILQDLKSLPETLPKLLVDPDSLSWLDLSHNELQIIDAILCDIPNLRILYLHGNHINNIDEVDKLGGIGTLKKLTLHGNALETTKNYRQYVLSRIPQLHNLDFSAVTKADRATVATWKKFNPQKKKRVKVED